MFLAASFNEMSKNLHVHQKVTLTLPTKQREKNNNYSNIAQVVKKKKFCQDFVPYSCHTWRKWRKVTAGCNFYHHLLMLWNCLRATVTYAKLCLHCTLVPPLNSAQNWHFPAETKTFQFVKKNEQQNTHVQSRQLQEHKGRHAVFKKRTFLVSWDGNHPLPQRPWEPAAWAAVGFKLCSQGFRETLGLWALKIHGDASAVLTGATRSSNKNFLMFRDEGPLSVSGFRACMVQQTRSTKVSEFLKSQWADCPRGWSTNFSRFCGSLPTCSTSSSQTGPPCTCNIFAEHFHAITW